MVAYDDNNWMHNLESLNLSESDCDRARILLASKDAGFRQGMLGGRNAESNKRVILMALGEFVLDIQLPCMESGPLLPTIVRHLQQA